MQIKINTPIWKTRSVGIAVEKITGDLEVEILYKDKFGNQLYPDILMMSKERALAYPSKVFGNTPPLKIIPIVDFIKKKPEEISEDEKARRAYMKANGLPY